MNEINGWHRRCRWLLVGLWLTASGSTLATATEREDPRVYVQQLGDLRFALRERATEKLVQMGSAAIAALEEGRRHRDREIRYRCERILALVRKNDFQRRLEAFAADVRGDSDYGLPGWSAYRDLLGATANARSLFVEMLRAEPELFEAIPEGAKAVSFVLENRALQLQQQAQLAGDPVSFGTTVALLFCTTLADVEASDQAVNFVLGLCFQGYFEKAMAESPFRELIRRLAGKAVEKSKDWPAYTAIRLAMRYDLKEGLTPALRALQGGQNLNIVYVRQFALLAIARFGDKAQTELLESLLEDATPCVPGQAVNRPMTHETQIRDVALAVLWKVHGEDPRQHGFSDRLQEDPQLVFHPSSLAFASEEERQTALKDWQEFRAKSPSAPRPR